MRYLLALFAFIAGIGISSFEKAHAIEIAVSPARFELEIGGKRKTQSIEIVNTSSREIEVGVELANFDLDENNEIRILPPSEQSLDQWIAINPSRVVIPAKGRRTMRFAIRPQVQPEPGEHRAIIFLNQGNAGQDEAAISFKFRIGVVVYGQMGEHDRNAKLHNVIQNENGIALDIQNTGNAHARFRGLFAIWDAASYPGDAEAKRMLSEIQATRKASEDVVAPGTLAAGVMTETPVLPGARRVIVQPLPNEAKAGQRRVYLLGKLGDNEVSTSFGL